jgi:hypothetical protein
VLLAAVWLGMSLHMEGVVWRGGCMPFGRHAELASTRLGLVGIHEEGQLAGGGQPATVLLSLGDCFSPCATQGECWRSTTWERQGPVLLLS